MKYSIDDIHLHELVSIPEQLSLKNISSLMVLSLYLSEVLRTIILTAIIGAAIIIII
ncbi:hypothetical protein RO3G_15358 [Rhizopus delemar RA 99-880]|uniref:Uncharacterized protein n=1 Tax=Rhizopus delemar (strain RA 99-880 / ATCC MYA-4621 / FGSC 9543 / NRRL 43880) TaxID=246409 RepID=I1CQB7_RHIO9|nr:hypothetical protein RO3G_15358 [Rhizopus delemar RA 99-880]|eukprot:EIE90647.1 hypothetical protein RO3G_15358 [Rhizopus delemar RA 99-880]